MSFMNLFWVERVLRVAVALLMLAMGLQTGFIVFYVVAGVLGVTGVVGYCPINQLAGLGETPPARHCEPTNPAPHKAA